MPAKACDTSWRCLLRAHASMPTKKNQANAAAHRQHTDHQASWCDQSALEFRSARWLAAGGPSQKPQNETDEKTGSRFESARRRHKMLCTSVEECIFEEKRPVGGSKQCVANCEAPFFFCSIRQAQGVAFLPAPFSYPGPLLQRSSYPQVSETRFVPSLFLFFFSGQPTILGLNASADFHFSTL